MTPQQRKWLELIRMASDGRGMYAGERIDVIPPKHLRAFERSGWVDIVIPHNPVHKERVAITDAGRAALAAQ